MPLLLALEGTGPGRAYLLSCATGLVFFMGLFAWIFSVPGFNLLDFLLLALYLCQYVGVWGLGLVWIRRWTGLPGALVAPPLWVVLEYVRGHLGFLSLPWMLLGHSQYLHPALIQITSLTGVYGLSFVIVLTNVAVAETVGYLRGRRFERAAGLLRVRALAAAGAAALLLAATVLYGHAILAQEPLGERIRIALVQGNVPQDRKWDAAFRRLTLDRHASLSRDAAREAPALIVWPETAVPGDVRHDDALRGAVAQIAREARSPLLVGSAEHAKFTDQALRGKHFNSMVLFGPDGKIADEYRKLVLVPFGEYEPLRDVVPWPRFIVASTGNSVPGDRHTVFGVGEVKLATTICWENIFPDVFREFVRRGARLVVNATNEAWFLDTAAPYQFLAISVFRAAEHRVTVARAANTGISALIDPRGRISQRLRGPDQRELFVDGVLVADAFVTRDETFYTSWGDVFAFLQIGGAAGLLLWAAAVRRRDAPSPGLPVPARV